MKKRFILITVACALLLILSLYIFIPGKLTSSASVLVNATSSGVYRCLTDKNQLQQLSGIPVTENTFVYDGEQYMVNGKIIDGLIVHIKNEDSFTTSVIRVLPLENDSSAIVWESSIAASANPFTKISQYFYGKKLSKNMSYILTNMQQYLNKEENIYGLSIKKDKITDSLLIYLKSAYQIYPTNENIYQTISQLQSYAASQGAHTTNNPMLNITQSGGSGYVTTVAIPIDKDIEGTGGGIELKSLVQGNILVTEIKGGPATILNAWNAMQNYLTDHGYESPGIPYQSLITNRITEKDTAKWTSTISCPIY